MRPGLAEHGGHGVEDFRVAAGHDADGIELVEDEQTIAVRGQSGEQRHGGLLPSEELAADLGRPLGRVDQVQSHGEYRPTHLGHLLHHLGNDAGLADSSWPFQEYSTRGGIWIEEGVGDPIRLGPRDRQIADSVRPGLQKFPCALGQANGEALVPAQLGRPDTAAFQFFPDFVCGNTPMHRVHSKSG